VKKTILDTVGALTREAPTHEEVDRAKTRILQGMDRTFANSQQLAMELNETIASGDWRLLFTNYEEIRRVTPDDVVRVAKTYFTDSNRTVGVFIPDAAPERTTVPEAPQIDALLKMYTPDIHVNVGDAIDPSPASIERRVQRITLPGGSHLVMLSKGTRGDRVQATLTLRFGDEHSLAGRAAAAAMTDALLMRGTTTKTRQQLQDEMQRLNATINVGGGGGRGGGGVRTNGAVSASISTTEQNLVPALRLAVDILEHPAFPATDFEQIRQQQIAGIERGRTEPGTLASQMLQAHLSQFPRSDVRHIRTIDEELEDLKAVTLEDVKAFHQEFFGASQGELVAVGKFDPPALQQAATELLGPWKSVSPYARVTNAYAPVASINAKIETPDKENAQFSAGVRLRMKDSDADYPALMMANYMFGGGGLTARFPDRVRNREGLSYSVSTSFTAPVEGDAAVFSASAIANPANTPKVEASFVDELTKTLRDGFTAPELARAKAAVRDERIGSRSSDQGILALLEAREPYGRTLAWDEQMDGKLQALTVEEVNAAFRKYVSPAQVSIVKGGDFKAANVYR
jgi:zinc protease